MGNSEFIILRMSLLKRAIAEAIILQAIEDLWDDEEKGESIDFFRGEGFGLCSEIACIDSSGRIKLLNIVKTIINMRGTAL
ncbi:MAG: hypothetical protein AB1632_09145 [Nitrospirota bacterium]